MRVQVLITYSPSLHPTLLRKNWDMVDGWKSVKDIDLTITRECVEAPPISDRIERYCALRNGLLDRHLRTSTEVVVMLDSDIVAFAPPMFRELVSFCYQMQHVVAPSIYLERGPAPEWFYDTWGFVRHGKKFTHEFPHTDWEPEVGGPVAMDCVGCLYAMPAKLLHAGVRYTKVEGWTDHMGICQEYKEMGYPVTWIHDLIAMHANLPEYGLKWNGEEI